MVIDKLELSEKHSIRGFDNYFGRIQAEGLLWDHKRVERTIYNVAVVV
jgi:hypothetical protein